MLCAIWIPNYDLTPKLMLTILSLVKFLWNFNTAQPDRKGMVWRILPEFWVMAVSLLLALSYVAVSAIYRTWIPGVLGLLSVLLTLVEMFTAKQKKPTPAGKPVNPTPTVTAPVPPLPHWEEPAVAKRPVLTLDQLPQTDRYRGKRFSILGDSLSTLEGYNPPGSHVFYTGEVCHRAGVPTMEDTWWGQGIRHLGGELLVNNSWSGSQVAALPDATLDDLFPSGCSRQRTAGLHTATATPDVIIVYMGFNDWGHGMPLDDPTDDLILEPLERSIHRTGTAYEHMLCQLRKNYPDAEIWCCTLIPTRMSCKPDFVFPEQLHGQSYRSFNQVFKNLVYGDNCRILDLGSCDILIDTIDGSHPTREGMTDTARCVLTCLLT